MCKQWSTQYSIEVCSMHLKSHTLLWWGKYTWLWSSTVKVCMLSYKLWQYPRPIDDDDLYLTHSQDLKVIYSSEECNDVWTIIYSTSNVPKYPFSKSGVPVPVPTFPGNLAYRSIFRFFNKTCKGKWWYGFIPVRSLCLKFIYFSFYFSYELPPLRFQCILWAISFENCINQPTILVIWTYKIRALIVMVF